jgi:hypothetical protein
VAGKGREGSAAGSGWRRLLGSGRRQAIAVVAVLAAVAATAQAEVIQVGNVRIVVAGAIDPSRLPQEELAPTSLELEAAISTIDKTHVPRLETITVESNSHGKIDATGIPTCSTASLTGTITRQAEQICGKALIGKGSASAEIAFPEQPPFHASGPMLIFNGPPKNGKPVFVVHVYSFVPAPTTFVTTGVVHRGGGGGPRISFRIPTIVGGQGSLTGFTATLRRVIRANCPAPSGLPGAVFPFAKSTFVFEGGTKLRSVLVKQCKVEK